MVVHALGCRGAHVLQLERAPGSDDRRSQDGDDVSGAGQGPQSDDGA